MAGNDSTWHFICWAWSNTMGALKGYKDGVLKIKIRNVKRGYNISSGGSLVLAQDQISFQQFQQDHVFKGSLVNPNLWSYVLPAKSIGELSKSCLYGDGDVYMWTDFKDGVRGDVRVKDPSPCFPQGSKR